MFEGEPFWKREASVSGFFEDEAEKELSLPKSVAGGLPLPRGLVAPSFGT